MIDITIEERKIQQIQDLVRSEPANQELLGQFRLHQNALEKMTTALTPEQQRILKDYLEICDALHLEALRAACKRLVAQEQKWSGYLYF